MKLLLCLYVNVLRENSQVDVIIVSEHYGSGILVGVSDLGYL